MTDSEIDEAILSSVEPSWRKVAMVIGTTAQKLYGDLSGGEEAYKLIAGRIETLVESRRLQARGDIKRWRFCEVKRP